MEFFTPGIQIVGARYLGIVLVSLSLLSPISETDIEKGKLFLG